MRLGTRWPLGTTPPDGLPDPVREALRRIESVRPADDRATWTLTWLEGLPRVELDDGTLVTYSAEEGAARVLRPGEPEDPEDSL